ncbi:phospholipase D/nuclease [Aspergillus heteromorphus CBS 117.55]|uniref:Phospholipase D/nuclease n=1 Tax=Aspergillus heteromorphus CBS 117.55 TaxID=1448321 RepID=A0A317WAN3_9EURO|nr:phospholipase D/nuclease [Aspergillus heteromorphus CBS 117.55]PWY82965.1 phospholipase D/nuclease [Aspergillus heteromorphus CBS 117.55]
MNPDELDDADLRAAIAASMADRQHSDPDQTNRPKKSEVVDLTADSDSDDVRPVFPKSRSLIGSDTDDDDDEDDDEDIKKAIALSLQEIGGNFNHPSEPWQVIGSDTSESQSALPLHSTATKTKTDDQEPAKPQGILGLDRKQMEQERLARLAKRKADDPAVSEQPQTKQSKVDLSRKPGVSELNMRTGDMAAASRAGSSWATPSMTPSIQYPDGVVKKTWASGCARQNDDIRIEEVFQKSNLELAVLSSFMWDPDWVYSKLDIKNTRFIMVMHAPDDSTRRALEADVAEVPNVRVCFPPMEGQVKCMHSKLMLLFHPGYLRIVVPTANLVPFDWGEMEGVMENSVFLIDLPKKNGTDSNKPNTAFYKELAYFLKASTLHDNVIAKMDGFDFSKTSKYAFVHTIGGSHTGAAWTKTGYCGLGHAVATLGLSTSKPLNLDYVTSSLGNINNEFLRSLYLASQGDIGLTDYTLRTSKSFPARLHNNLIPKDLASESKDRFRIYYPSQSTVLSSKGGPRCAGTICCQSRWFEGEKFPRQALRDCESQRPRLLMHSKILYVRPDNPIRLSDTSECRAWAYVGSANLSESAWGRIIQDRKTKTPKLNCRNWECGVIVPVIEKIAPTRPDNDLAEKKEESVSITLASSSSLSSSSESSTSEPKLESAAAAQALALARDDGSALPTVFRGLVPVPMRVPGLKYGGTRKPWCLSGEM